MVVKNMPDCILSSILFLELFFLFGQSSKRIMLDKRLLENKCFPKIRCTVVSKLKIARPVNRNP